MKIDAREKNEIFNQIGHYSDSCPKYLLYFAA
jgi:hypothetical protein